MKWFRFYHEFMDDPKIAMMSDSDQLLWVKALCLASDSGVRGVILLTDDEVCWKLRITNETWQHALDKFRAKGMIEHCEGGYKIINWDKRQFESDSSAKRVARHRKKKAKVTVTKLKQKCNVTVTPSEQIRTDPDTNTESEKTTERAKKKAPSFSDFPESGRKSSVENFEDRFRGVEKVSPWCDPDGGYVESFVLFLEKTRFSKIESSDRRLKAVDAIRWVESRRASRADKDAMIEAWKCHQESLKVAAKAAEANVVRRIDYGSTAGHKFWSTTHGEVVDLELSKLLKTGRAKALTITNVLQNPQAYRICFDADGEKLEKTIRKDSVTAKEAIAS